jgi:hypothetical protein
LRYGDILFSRKVRGEVRFGSTAMGFYPERVAVASLFWLGVLPADLEDLTVPAQVQDSILSSGFYY